MSLHDIEYVLTKLSWMREQRIWPNGLRYLWTDAFGLVLLVSLYRDLHEERYLDDAEVLVRDVDRVLGRRRGIRIGEAPDRDGQYFHYLAMWLYALSSLSEHIPQYRARAIALARHVHRPFVLPEKGVVWKMKEDLSGRILVLVMAHWTHLTDTWCIASLESKRLRLKSWKCRS